MDHQNTDISINCAVQFVKELTDEEMEGEYSQMVFDVLYENNIQNFLQRLLSQLDVGTQDDVEKHQIILDLMLNMLDLSP